jgi:hypothetical protein
MKEFNKKILVSDLFEEMNEKNIEEKLWDKFISEKLTICN